MNTLDKLQDSLSGEMMLQSMYNPEVRQLFTQMRDAKMQNVTLLQQEINQMMMQGRVS